MIADNFDSSKNEHIFDTPDTQLYLLHLLWLFSVAAKTFQVVYQSFWQNVKNMEGERASHDY